MKKKFKVTGMTCSACAAHVERAVMKAGAKSCSVNLLSESMVAEYDEKSLGDGDIISAVVAAGYGAEIYKKEKTKEKEGRLPLIRLIVSAVLTVALLYVAMAHMLKLPFHAFFHKHYIIQSAIEFALAVSVIAINFGYFTRGFGRLFRLAPNMDSLIAMGSTASFAYSVYLFINFLVVGGEGPHLFLDASATILTLISLGKYFEGLSKRRTGKAIERLLELAPDTVIVVKDGKEETIPAENVNVGDIFVVKDGMRFAVDGVVTEGNASVDESYITGESIPVAKFAGEKVVSGTVLKSGYVYARATGVGEDTTLSRIVALVENANATKAPVQKIADKVAGVFVPAVIGVAALVLIIRLCVGASFGVALNYAVSVLVISCPCALGLATPVAIMVGTGKGAENGILIKSGEALQILGRVKRVAFDKTGTLTHGAPVVTDVIAAEGNEEDFLPALFSAEKLSSHPLAEAVVKYSESKNTKLLPVENFVSVNGKGISAQIEGKKYLFGSAAYIEESGVDLGKMKDVLAEYASMGKTPLLVATDRVEGAVFLRDEPKENSSAAIERLSRLGIDSYMLTGDNELTARAIASEVGINNVYAGILPGEKERIVGELIKEGETAFVGDGVNDAPALTRASVGIAIGAGSDIAIESADVVLMKNDVSDVADAILLSRKTMRNIKQNLFWAFFYNALCIPLAAGAFSFAGIKLDPMYCALAMSLSSIFVVCNALRLRLIRLGEKSSRHSPKETHGPKESSASDKTVASEETRVANGAKSENGANGANTINDNKKKETKTMTVRIEGMMCGNCVKHVEKALNSIDGVTAKADLERGLAEVTLTKQVPSEAIRKAIEEEGYIVKSIEM